MNNNAGRIIVLVVGLIVLVFGVLTVLGSGLPGARVSDQFVESFAMEPGEMLRVTSSNGAISYEPWDGEEVVIEATRTKSRFMADLMERIWGETTVVFNRTAGMVEAVVERPSRGWLSDGTSVRFHVKVPVDWHGMIELRTSNGRITADEIHGDVTVRTSNGAITINGHTGTLQARTSNGSIRLTDVHGEVAARTSNGPVTLMNGTLTDSGYIRTSNGAVQLQARLESGASYDVDTSNGAVTVTLIEPDARLDLRTSNGGINLHTEIRTSTLERNRVVGTIGDGAARLNVRTSNGAVTLSAISAD